MRIINKFQLGLAGNMAITTAIAGGVLTLSVGAAIDGARMVNHANQIQSIADTAALAAMHPEDMQYAERERIALAAVNSTMEQTPRAFLLDEPTITLNEATQTVEVDLTAKVPMIFGTLLGDDRRVVRGNAVAAEYNSGQNGGLFSRVSLSFVLDASLSMDDRLSNSRRLDAIRAAVNDVFGGARDADPASSIEAAIYPYDWGLNEARMEELQPGTQGLIDALAYLTTSEGGVPSEALEKAVKEQMDAKGEDGEDVRRMVIYITDGAVDSEKGDARGKILTKGDFFAAGSPAGCGTTPPELEDAQQELAQWLLKAGVDNGRPVRTPENAFFDDDDYKFDSGLGAAENHMRRVDLMDMATDMLLNDRLANGTPFIGETAANADPIEVHSLTNPDLPLLEKGVNLPDAALHVEEVRDARAVLDVEMRNFAEVCRPRQEQRVIEACSGARDSAVEIMAINLSGAAGTAAEITSTCAFEDPDTPRKEAEALPEPQILGGGAKGSLMYEADDGSVYAVINDEASLRELLRTLLPEEITMTTGNKGERNVRLIR